MAVSDTVLALMRQIDELNLQYPLAEGCMLRDLLQQESYGRGRRQVTILMRRMGITAIYRMPKISLRHPIHQIYLYLHRSRLPVYE